MIFIINYLHGCMVVSFKHCVYLEARHGALHGDLQSVNCRNVFLILLLYWKPVWIDTKLLRIFFDEDVHCFLLAVGDIDCVLLH